MRTKITQNIDGYDIIIGIGEAQIDGVATMPIVENALRETVEYKAVEAKKQELSVLINQTAQAMKTHVTVKLNLKRINMFQNISKV
jgi:hypothetical protein